jgi:hypothetical protein
MRPPVFQQGCKVGQSYRRRYVLLHPLRRFGRVVGKPEAPARDGGVGTDGPGGTIKDGDGVEIEVTGSRPVRALVAAHVLAARADGQKRVAIARTRSGSPVPVRLKLSER